VSLYRAVSPAEFADIARVGGFRAAPGGGSLSAKQFATSLDDAVKFANQYPELAAVIRADIPQSTFNQLQFSRTIDPFIFRGGVVTAQPGAQQQLLNQTIITLEHAF
jgi:filamentous hemagglutinin